VGFESLTGGGGLAFGDATSGADGFFETGAFNGGNIAAPNNTALYLIAAVGVFAVLWLKK
jgi:hypothetical protein